jgi:hypothetical protein
MRRILDCKVEELLCHDRILFNSFFSVCCSFSLHSHGGDFPSHSTPCILHFSPLTPHPSYPSLHSPHPSLYPAHLDDIIVKVRAPMKLLRATADSEEYALVLDEESSITQVSGAWCGVV